MRVKASLIPRICHRRRRRVKAGRWLGRAVLFQAVADTSRRDLAGITAREFLVDPAVQDLAAALWGVEVSPNVDAHCAARAIEAYQRWVERR